MSATLPLAEAVLCSYNGAQYIGDQMDSLRRQSAQLQRVSVFDDRSDDASVAIVSAFREVLPLVCKVNERRLGAVANFNQALSRAQMPIVFLSDQDDVWAPNKVERMLRFMAERPALLLVGSDALLVDRQGRSTGRSLLHQLGARGASGWTQREWLFRLLRRNIVTGATIAVRRELLQLALPIPPGYWHDEWLALVAAAIEKIGWIEEPLMHYRLHGKNVAGLAGIGAMAKLRAALTGGTRHHSVRAAKLDSLANLLASVPTLACEAGPATVEEARRFWHRRATPASSRAERWQQAIRTWRAGLYHRYADGAKSFARDLLT